MALQQVNWAKFLSPGSNVPPDVFFLVQGEDGKSCKIGAHRLLLAGVSPVFERMFFGPMKGSEETVEVKETSPEAFQVMIDYIYKDLGDGKDGRDRILEDLRWSLKSPKTVCELYALGDNYDIPNLKTKIMDYLEVGWMDGFRITKDNLIDTAIVASSYKELFVDLSTVLQMKCLQFYLESKDKNFPEFGEILDELMEVGRSTLQLLGNKSSSVRIHYFIPDTFLQVGVP